jgi:hypothetical protein
MIYLVHMRGGGAWTPSSVGVNFDPIQGKINWVWVLSKRRRAHA